VLHLDSDESCDEKMRSEIQKNKKNLKDANYSFNRLTNYAGHWVRHCGWYPDKKTRLWDKTKAQWGGTNPHDLVVFETPEQAIHLKGDLLHYSYASISEHIIQTNKFTTIAALALYRKGVKSNLIKITLRPVWQFFRDYILKRGFQDGFYGLVICSINSMSVFLKYTKLWVLEKKN